MKLFTAALLIAGFAISANAQTSGCANPAAPRILIGLSSTLDSVNRFGAILENEFEVQGGCRFDGKILDLTTTLTVYVDGAASRHVSGPVALSLEFDVPENILGMKVVKVFPILIEPEDTNSDLVQKAKIILDRYNAFVGRFVATEHPK